VYHTLVNKDEYKETYYDDDDDDDGNNTCARAGVSAGRDEWIQLTTFRESSKYQMLNFAQHPHLNLNR